MTGVLPSRGPVVLVGGAEHRPACAPLDRWVLERTGRSRPRVAVLPAASPPGTTAATAALARTHWAALGAQPVVITAREDPSRARDLVAAADVVVLTGGIPNLLIARLGASGLWEAVIDRWEGGGALVGSSAGAMALCAWRLRLRPPRPLSLLPGLGPVADAVVVPHAERLLHPWRPLRRLARSRPGRWDLDLLALDESTALVIDGPAAQVRGPGAVLRVGRDGLQQARSGEHLPAPALVGGDRAPAAVPI